MTTLYTAPWNGLPETDIIDYKDTTIHRDRSGRIIGATIATNGWLAIRGKDGKNPTIYDRGFFEWSRIVTPGRINRNCSFKNEDLER